MTQRPVLQFKITLLDIEPTIWRRIQVSDLCTFWDLHVAIQDVMGWKDCHLHQFQIIHPKTQQKEFMGIPDEDGISIYNTLPGWNYKIKDYLATNEKMLYEYDFGDGWMHSVAFEGQCEKQSKQKYPVCLDGERACPPEDVGGILGFYNFLETIKDPKNEDYESMLTWVGGYYDPAEFEARKIKFDNPSKRWKYAFEDN